MSGGTGAAPTVVKAADALREMRICRLPELGDAPIEPRIDGGAFLEHHGRGQPVKMEELEPAMEARAKKGTAVGRVGRQARAASRDGHLEAIVEIVRDGQEHP